MRKLRRSLVRKRSASADTAVEPPLRGEEQSEPSSPRSSLPSGPVVRRHTTQSLLSSAVLAEVAVRAAVTGAGGAAERHVEGLVHRAKHTAKHARAYTKKRIYKGIQSAVGKKLASVYLGSIKYSITPDRRVPWRVRVLLHGEPYWVTRTLPSPPPPPHTPQNAPRPHTLPPIGPIAHTHPPPLTTHAAQPVPHPASLRDGR